MNSDDMILWRKHTQPADVRKPQPLNVENLSDVEKLKHKFPLLNPTKLKGW
jgi:hypothetical protein